MNNQDTLQNSHAPQDTQRGSALIVAMFLMIFAVGIVMSGSITMHSTKQRTEVAFMLSGQASAFARSGLTEATNWFRRQTTQPVTAFAPVLDTGADPQILDTKEPEIGLVREAKIAGNVFGRYEVWKQWDADPDTVRLEWRNQFRIADVSSERGRGVMGTVWRLRCVGYVFVQRDPTKAFREKPNYVIATEVLESEISRMAFALPGQAAICTSVASDMNLGNNVRVDGGDAAAGIYYPSSSGDPTIDQALVTGVPPTSPASTGNYDDSIKYVFGVSDSRLRAMADIYFTDPDDFPPKVNSGGITMLESAVPITFTNLRPLTGYGIVVIKGDVVISAGSSTFFFGLLYVDGSLSIQSPCLIQGAIVATGAITASGIGDYVDIIYDDAVIAKMQETTANYRISRAPRRQFQSE